MNALGFVVSRLKEPSSYAGLGMLLSTLGIQLPDATLQAGVQVAVAAAGLVAVLIPERRTAVPSPSVSSLPTPPGPS